MRIREFSNRYATGQASLFIYGSPVPEHPGASDRRLASILSVWMGGEVPGTMIGVSRPHSASALDSLSFDDRARYKLGYPRMLQGRLASHEADVVEPSCLQSQERGRINTRDVIHYNGT